MNVVDALRSRTSIRAYTDQPVSQDAVSTLLNQARWSPSGGNMQPWKVVAVSGKAQRDICDLALKTVMANPVGEADDYPIYPKGIGEPYRSRRAVNGEQMYATLGIARDDRMGRLTWLQNNFRFFGAPVGLFFIIDRNMERGQWAHLGMFMQSVALCATAGGYATCMQEAWAMVRRTLHGALNLEEHELLYCGMALGYADPDAPVNAMRSERDPVEAFARFEGFED